MKDEKVYVNQILESIAIIEDFDYYQIDLTLVWETVESDLPELKSKLKVLID